MLRASLRDLVDAANNLLARTNRTQLLLVTNQDVGLAVDLLGDLTSKSRPPSAVAATCTSAFAGD